MQSDFHLGHNLGPTQYPQSRINAEFLNCTLRSLLRTCSPQNMVVAAFANW